MNVGDVVWVDFPPGAGRAQAGGDRFRSFTHSIAYSADDSTRCFAVSRHCAR